MVAWLTRGFRNARYLWIAPVPRNAVKVALPVGAVLNLINQGHALFGSEPIAWGLFLLNFVVPYCVASWSAARMRYLTDQARAIHNRKAEDEPARR